MAQHALRFLESHSGTTLVALAGTGHAWKRGIPARVRDRATSPLRVIMPEIGAEELADTTTEDRSACGST